MHREFAQAACNLRGSSAEERKQWEETEGTEGTGATTDEHGCRKGRSDALPGGEDEINGRRGINRRDRSAAKPQTKLNALNRLNKLNQESPAANAQRICAGCVQLEG
jgi:hypothetical protein